MDMAFTFQEWNVDAIEKGLRAKKFFDWMAHRQLRPWMWNPELRADYRTAALCMTIFNSQVTKREHMKKFKDFLMNFEDVIEKKPRTQSLKTQWEMLQILAAMHATEGPKTER